MNWEEAKQKIATNNGYIDWDTLMLQEAYNSVLHADDFYKAAAELLDPQTDGDLSKYYTAEHMFEDHGLRLVMTCGACPEQYDVFKGDNQIGYLRLRHGYFRTEYYGKIVYSANPEGDGAFTFEERMPQLHKAMKALLEADR